jgi:hypothetical protein
MDKIEEIRRGYRDLVPSGVREIAISQVKRSIEDIQILLAEIDKLREERRGKVMFIPNPTNTKRCEGCTLDLGEIRCGCTNLGHIGPRIPSSYCPAHPDHKE